MCEVELIEKAGHGGNAKVYLGTFSKTGEKCVVKRAVRKKEAYLQLGNEWRILKLLNDLGYEHAPMGISYSGKELVMEHIDGVTLDKTDLEGFTENEFKGLIVSICAAVEKLHGLDWPVIHRDLKPSNIILDKTGKIYLIDFGTAKIAEGYQEKTFEKEKLPDVINGAGTKRFAAPEQYGGLFDESFLTDIYQLGKTIEYLIGRGDFSESFKNEIMALVNRCCMSDALERYHRVSEFRSDVLNVKVRKSRKHFIGAGFFYRNIKRNWAKNEKNRRNSELFIDIVRTFDTIEFL